MYISAAEMYILAREMYISRREIKFIGYVDRFSEQAEYVFLPYLFYFFPNVKRRECLHRCSYHLSFILFPLPTGEGPGERLGWLGF